MIFFKHMTNMRHDPKIKRLLRRYKANGYAIYNFILECIAEKLTTDSPLPVLEETIEDMSYDLGIPESQIEEIVKYLSTNDLIQIVPETGIVYCLKVFKFINTSQTRSKEMRKVIQICSGKKDEDLTYNDIKLQIEANIMKNYNKNEHEKLPDFTSETKRDKNERRRREEEEKKRRREEEKEENEIKDISSMIDNSIEYWNNKELPKCRYTSIQLPKIANITVKFDVLGLEDINKAIENLSICYDKIEKQYRPSSFHNFIVNSVDSWLDEVNPLERYKKDENEKEKIKTDNKSIMNEYEKMKAEAYGSN